MKKITRTAILITAAALVMIAGNMSRPYTAFGGEDLLGLVLIGTAVREMFRKEQENE